MPPLFRHTPTDERSAATLAVDTTMVADHRIPDKLFGKFAEHLGWNIYHGMDAQLLYNPTVGSWAFPAGTSGSPDGGQTSAHDADVIAEQISEYAAILDFPSADPLKGAYDDGLAFWWQKRGPTNAVRCSPAVGPTGDRAQRVEIRETAPTSRAGIQQWLYLPLQRTHTYELTARLRASNEAEISFSLEATTSDGAPTGRLTTHTAMVGESWTTVEASLTVQAPVDDPDDSVLFCVTAPESTNLVIDQLRLYPDDHVEHADPDVIKLLSDADLPMLRWPGGNFASGYHWRDGVGPLADRPTRPNPAWGGLEYNLFGTNEFLAVCEEVGCDPVICVNAGDGTPQEAARWVEYCNGDPVESKMGALRAEHGHPEPYNVRHWEIGNELYGHWQVQWTTPDGYVDRFDQFRSEMVAADPSIEILACGNRRAYDGDWNKTVIQETARSADYLTDHVLVGGTVDDDTDPTEHLHAVLGFADQLGAEYRTVREQLLSAGTCIPQIAITELQLHTRMSGDNTKSWSLPAAWRFSRRLPRSSMFPGSHSITEALFDATIAFESIRLGGIGAMVTHSATVNHGGGLQKQKERVWPDPCYYGQSMTRALSGRRPVAINCECETFSTGDSFGQIEQVDDVPVLDVIAAISEDRGSLIVMIVHRSPAGEPMEVTLDIGSFADACDGERVELTADDPTAENTATDSEKVVPTTSACSITAGTGTVTIPPLSLTKLTFEI